MTVIPVIHSRLAICVVKRSSVKIGDRDSINWLHIRGQSCKAESCECELCFNEQGLLEYLIRFSHMHRIEVADGSAEFNHYF